MLSRKNVLIAFNKTIKSQCSQGAHCDSNFETDVKFAGKPSATVFECLVQYPNA